MKQVGAEIVKLPKRVGDRHILVESTFTLKPDGKENKKRLEDSGLTTDVAPKTKKGKKK